jgi:hypothetical protein
MGSSITTGDADHESRAFAFDAFEGDRAAFAPDDRIADGESQTSVTFGPAAALIDPVETLEHMRLVRTVDAGAGVIDDQDGGRTVTGR